MSEEGNNGRQEFSVLEKRKKLSACTDIVGSSICDGVEYTKITLSTCSRCREGFMNGKAGHPAWNV